MKHLTPPTLAWGSVLVALLAGCNVPAAAPPVPDLELPAATAPDAMLSADWWTGFGDTRLDALVQEALAQNRDIARAVARIDEARASLRLADADRQPNVSAGVSAARRRNSETGPNPLGGGSAYANDLNASLQVSYELDLFGRLAAASSSARNELLATKFAHATTRLAVAAQVVQSDAAVLGLARQLVLYQQAVQAQRSALDLQQVRLEAGDITELDVQQLEAELAANEVQLPQLERAIGQAERALAVLLGRSPRAVIDANVPRPDAAAPPQLTSAPLPAGLSSDLLQRRPDVQAAEARLRAAGARMEVVRAAYYPSLALTGNLGRQSGELNRLLDGPSAIWNVTASLTQPIWNAGGLDSNYAVSEAQRRQVELDYRDAVANAFREARDALATQAETQATLATLQRRSQNLQRAADLTRVRFNGGIASRLDDINAQRAALAAQAQVVEAQRAVRAAQVDVFRAFGGGWKLPEPAPAAPGRSEAVGDPRGGWSRVLPRPGAPVNAKGETRPAGGRVKP